MCVSCLVVKWSLLHKRGVCVWRQPDTSVRNRGGLEQQEAKTHSCCGCGCRWLAVAGWLPHLWVCGWQLCEPVILIDAHGTMPCLLMGRDLLGQIWWLGVPRAGAA